MAIMVFDAAATELEVPRISCVDGIDNDADGLFDLANPDCLAGSNFGSGNPVPVSNVSGVRQLNDTGQAWLAGEWRGGTHFVDFNHEAETLMHEFGHNLGLEHGGNEVANCKPNYLSIMSYAHRPGIFQLRGLGGQDLDGDGDLDGVIIDGMGMSVQAQVNGDFDSDGPGDGDGDGLGTGHTRHSDRRCG